MQCACAILSSVAYPALKHFSTFSHKQHVFRKKKVTEYKMCALSLSTTFVWDISHSRRKWARYDKIMYIGIHVKCPLFLSDFNETWIFAKDFRKIIKYQISCKAVQWEPSCSIRTAITRLIVAFRNFAKAPKKLLNAVVAGNPSCMCHDTNTQPEYSQFHPTLIIAHI